jgi:hypothetical protein
VLEELGNTLRINHDEYLCGASRIAQVALPEGGARLYDTEFSKTKTY